MTLFWRQLRAAISFYTRLPVKWPEGLPLSQVHRHVVWVGLGIGLTTAAVYGLAADLWMPTVAVVLALITGVLMTGGLHEDGLADTCDGFGGGWQVTDKLRIMKDSALGTYGGLGLILMLVLQTVTLTALAALPLTGIGSPVMAALILGHVLSRALAVSFMQSLPYVRLHDSRVQAVTGALPKADFRWVVGSAMVVVAVICWLFDFSAMLLLALLIGLGGWRQLFCAILRRQLGGYTGDTLGAVQQTATVIVYLVLLAGLMP
ncbi:hypothetical protein BFW38_14865 [Terasakiispira papahanaumokuakeensis]|uniref:Adenosylcobinamide-GDP ribazoletransferase n=2 Tax=Terasakiispira papahanaumokuakeensis TaxID=197479 RepID=A0A1E2VFS1_9GAMM|nr:hypothetical protein BFW38_14865 [Terasakiispira papahanaumokuakeensis]